MSDADRPVPPMAALAVAVAAASTSAILIRASDAPEPVMAFYRVAFTVLLLAPFAGGLPADLRALGRRDRVAAAGAGVALAAHFALWFASVDLTTVAASVTLVQSQALVVAVAAVPLFDERLGRRKAAGVAVAVGGVAVMSLGGAEGGPAPAPLVGNALALAGAVALAAYVLAGRSVRQRVSLLPYVLVVYTVAAAGLLAVVLAGGHPLAGYPPHEWALFLGMAVGPGVLGHTVLNWALAHVESGVASVALVGEPVGSALLAVLLLAEVPGPLTVAGGAVALAGIALTARARRG